jgi:hypothetical protein
MVCKTGGRVHEREILNTSAAESSGSESLFNEKSLALAEVKNNIIII